MDIATVRSTYRNQDFLRRFGAHDPELRRAIRAQWAEIDARYEAAAAKGEEMRAMRIAHGLRVAPGCRYSEMDRRPHWQPQRLDGRPVMVGDPATYRLAPGGGERRWAGGSTAQQAICKDMARCARTARGLC